MSPDPLDRVPFKTRHIHIPITEKLLKASKRPPFSFMPAIQITTNLERTPWEDKREVFARQSDLGIITHIGRLPRGMQSGASSVTLIVKMPDGMEYAVQTSLALFQSAASALTTTDNLERQAERG